METSIKLGWTLVVLLVVTVATLALPPIESLEIPEEFVSFLVNKKSSPILYGGRACGVEREISVPFYTNHFIQFTFTPDVYFPAPGAPQPKYKLSEISEYMVGP